MWVRKASRFETSSGKTRRKLNGRVRSESRRGGFSVPCTTGLPVENPRKPRKACPVKTVENDGGKRHCDRGKRRGKTSLIADGRNYRNCRSDCSHALNCRISSACVCLREIFRFVYSLITRYDCLDYLTCCLSCNIYPILSKRWIINLFGGNIKCLLGNLWHVEELFKTWTFYLSFYKTFEIDTSVPVTLLNNGFRPRDKRSRRVPVKRVPGFPPGVAGARL